MNIKFGQIYLRADQSESGCIVVDCKTFFDKDDIVVIQFDTDRFYVPAMARIDIFKLTMVRYYLSENFPEWLHEGIKKELLWVQKNEHKFTEQFIKECLNESR